MPGGAALLSSSNTLRYRHDLDFFHDSEERVATAFAADRATLVEAGCSVEEEISQPGYVRAIVRRADDSTRIEWSHHSSWRFMPVIHSADFGYQLHPVDVATNKVLALAGRDEPRDLLDVMHLHESELPLGALVWADGSPPGCRHWTRRRTSSDPDHRRRRVVCTSTRRVVDACSRSRTTRPTRTSGARVACFRG